MKKQIKLWLIILSLGLLTWPTKIQAGQLKLVLSDPPDYINKNDFRVYYTYLETEDKTATVNLFIQKEGKDWRQTVDKNKTQVSDYFQLEDSDIYDGEGRYNFYATATTADQSLNSQTVTTNFDISAPASPSDYGKERINSTTFRLSWKNPHDDDFARVYIYRSKDSSFNADNDTKIGEMGGGREEKMTFNDGSVQEGKDYYYMLRAVDHAGNGSGLVGDTFESSGDSGSPATPEGQEVGAGETVSGQEYSASQTQGQILGEEKESTPSPQAKEEEKKEEGEEISEDKAWFSSWPWWLGGLIVLVFLYHRFFRPKRE